MVQPPWGDSDNEAEALFEQHLGLKVSDVLSSCITTYGKQMLFIEGASAVGRGAQT